MWLAPAQGKDDGRIVIEPFWAKPRFVALVIIAWLAVNFAVRMAMWPTLGLDDSEQALFAQHFAWSYRYRAPPLFTWLLLALGSSMGPSIGAISLVRYAFLAVTLAFTYLAARRLIRDPRLQALSVYSFGSIYLFAYYSHHDLTHTTALSAALAASWYVFLRLAASPTLGWYLLLGSAFGLGMLGKWNFAMFPPALSLACLLDARTRGLVLTWKLVPALIACAVIVLPAAIAAVELGPAHGEDIRSVLGGDAGPFVARFARGMGRLAASILLYPQPLLLVLLATLGFPFRRGVQRENGLTPPAAAPMSIIDARFLARTMAIAIALHILLVVLLGATDFSERLMQPALLIMPVWMFMVVDRGRLSPRELNRIALIFALFSLAFLAARAVVYVRGADGCGACRAMVPFADLAAGLRSEGYSGGGTIIAEDWHIGGNLRAPFPNARIIDPDYPPAAWPAASGRGPCLLVWRQQEDLGETEEARAKLEKYLSGQLGGAIDAPHRDGQVSAPMFHSAKRRYALRYRLFDGPVGECR